MKFIISSGDTRTINQLGVAFAQAAVLGAGSKENIKTNSKHFQNSPAEF